MSDTPDRPAKRRGPLTWLGGRSRRFWVAVALLTPVLYVLSVGPSCWLDRNTRSYRFSEFMDLAYRPLWLACLPSDSATRLLLCYAWIWGPRSGVGPIPTPPGYLAAGHPYRLPDWILF